MKVFLASAVILFLAVSKSFCRECPFMGSGRMAKPVTNLGNCSWYEYSACCERAEVTSVFEEMLPLQLASTKCRNYMNYLMCYFCSPNQYNFITAAGGIRQTRICKNFCEDLFTNCRDAHYKDQRLDSHYSSGTEFCQANAFQVDTRRCLAFNESAFPSSKAPSGIQPSFSVLFILVPFFIALIWI